MEMLKEDTGFQGKLLLSNYENQKSFRNFMLSLRSESTRKLYSFYLLKFLSQNQNYVDLSFDEILKIDPKIIEADIIETMIKMKENEKLSSSFFASFVKQQYFISSHQRCDVKSKENLQIYWRT